MEGAALATAIVNKLQGKFITLVINAPAGDNKKITLEDIAFLTGGRMFSEAKGDKLEKAEISDLGRAEKFVCRREESVIVGPKGKKADIKKAIDDLQKALDGETNESRKKELQHRIGMFTNKVAVIRVGAPTESEQKALKYKVEDAVNATKSAYRHGVVCGAGLSLARLKTSSPILNEALQYPHRQLCENMGIDEGMDLKGDQVMNVVTGKRGNFLEVGVMDPVEVLIAGVESAVSIASTLVTSTGIIVEHAKNEGKSE
jgi:chaperonin GroEL